MKDEIGISVIVGEFGGIVVSLLSENDHIQKVKGYAEGSDLFSEKWVPLEAEGSESHVQERT